MKRRSDLRFVCLRADQALQQCSDALRQRLLVAQLWPRSTLVDNVWDSPNKFVTQFRSLFVRHFVPGRRPRQRGYRSRNACLAAPAPVHCS